MIELAEGRIQVFNTWTSDEWDTNELIDTAEVIEGIRFVPLSSVLRWKTTHHRAKDREDIRILEAHLGHPPEE